MGVITTQKALEIINQGASVGNRMARPALEAWIRSGNCPFGTYIKQDGKSSGRYVIFPQRLLAYLNAEDIKGGGDEIVG